MAGIAAWVGVRLNHAPACAASPNASISRRGRCLSRRPLGTPRLAGHCLAGRRFFTRAPACAASLPSSSVGPPGSRTFRNLPTCPALRQWAVVTDHWRRPGAALSLFIHGRRGRALRNSPPIPALHRLARPLFRFGGCARAARRRPSALLPNPAGRCLIRALAAPSDHQLHFTRASFHQLAKARVAAGAFAETRLAATLSVAAISVQKSRLMHKNGTAVPQVFLLCIYHVQNSLRKSGRRAANGRGCTEASTSA
jgi:hypothetical protein